MLKEIYISVDVETAGPTPADFALLSIGACLVDDPAQSFYVELRPDRDQALPEALQVSGLSMEDLRATGQPPKIAMQAFAVWVRKVAPPGTRPVFVALNAPFDWMFIADYFQRYVGKNPFGHSALDIKAYFMGKTGVSWSETSISHISSRLLTETHLSHNALCDARDQAELFRLIKEQVG